MHVETEESDILERRSHLRDGKCLVERDAELHPLFARASVGVWGVDKDFRIHSQRDGSDNAKPLRYRIEGVQLLCRLR